MQAIQKELGDRDEFKNELTEMEERAKQKNLSREAQTKVKKELKKLRMMAPMSAEAAVVRNYVDWVLALPWGRRPKRSWTSSRRSASSTRTTTASRRSRSASSSTWPCRRW